MSGVYGGFLENFPEIQERVYVWTNDRNTEERVITGAFIPQDGNKIKRRKYTSGNTGLDIVGSDDLYVYSCFSKSIYIGDYIELENIKGIRRVVDIVDYTESAGYMVCKVELVSGTTADMDEKLVLKEAQFDN